MFVPSRSAQAEEAQQPKDPVNKRLSSSFPPFSVSLRLNEMETSSPPDERITKRIWLESRKYLSTHTHVL